MLTLWDIMKPVVAMLTASPREAKPRRLPAPKPARDTPARETMQGRYDRVTLAMLAKYGIKVRKWRKNSSGIAWQNTYRDGSVKRFLEAPRPRGPMSAAVFLHEVGHHHIGFRTYKPRCLEEYHAWMFALREMEANGLNITPAVHRRVERSLKYAVGKARRRGLRELPEELAKYA